MTSLCRSYTAKFILEAASLVLDQGYSVSEASRSLDVGDTLHHRWGLQRQHQRDMAPPYP